ncbi:MAG: 2-amino-4-hydroxy-6-hydroxymethyldihydropteridine diphosphokinase [Caldimonas sp.]
MLPAAPGEEAFIGLGSNLGDRRATLERAFSAIAALPGTREVARSSLYQSAPLQAGGGDYLNAVVEVRTTLAPPALLQALQAIETRFGRERPFANAPRTLDLDLLLYGTLQCAGAGLVVPHPRLHERAFVLVPLAEIAPGVRVPGRGAVDALLPAVAAQRIAKLDR